jgi:hypothetical protein
MNPRAKKKVSTIISQGIGSTKAKKAVAKVSVLVSTDAPSPIRAATMQPETCAQRCRCFRSDQFLLEL